MTRRPDLFPPDRGLQARMAAGIAINAVLVLGVLALLAWPMVDDLRLFGLLFFFLGFAIIGAEASARRTRRRGRGAVAADQERVEGTVQRLCLLADLPVPKVKIEADDLPLTWTVSVPWDAPKLHATTALLDALPESELEAVIAHELSHLANRDATVMTLLAAPSAWVLRGVAQMWADRKKDFRNVLAAIYFGSYCVPLASLLLVSSRVVSRHRELAADRGAAMLTGSPSALASGGAPPTRVAPDQWVGAKRLGRLAVRIVVGQLSSPARPRTARSFDAREDLRRHSFRSRALVGARRCRRQDPRPVCDPDRGHPARQAQAAVHTPHRRGRLRHRDQCREDRGHGQQAG